MFFSSHSEKSTINSLMYSLSFKSYVFIKLYHTKLTSLKPFSGYFFLCCFIFFSCIIFPVHFTFH